MKKLAITLLVVTFIQLSSFSQNFTTDISVESGSGAEVNLLNTTSNSEWQVVSGHNSGFEIGNVTTGKTDTDAHFYINNSGSIGIGTTSPLDKVHILAGYNAGLLRGITLRNSNSTNNASAVGIGFIASGGNQRKGLLAFQRTSSNGIGDFVFALNNANDASDATMSDEVMRINKDGDVGIGTTSPDFKLDIVDNTEQITTLQVRNTSGLANSGTAIRLYPSPGGTNRPSKLSNIPDSYGANFIFNVRKADASYEDAMIIRGDGNVGIGTTTPEAMLTVAGKIKSQEVKVTVDAGQGPDYVFEEDYDLRSLEKTEEFIKANKHLPEVPSAKVMESEGLNLKEMNLMLLQKIEELTLHQIEQNKSLKNALDKIESLENAIEILKEK